MSDQETPNVGGRVRLLREQKGLSLRALAQKCGLSVNAISRIERGDTSPTVSSLQMLATALEVPITELFSDHTEHLTVFIPRDHRLRSKTNGIIMESLGFGLRNQQLEPFMILLNPEDDNMMDEVSHTGQEFVLCVEGKVEYSVGGSVYSLEEGDSLLFEASQPHCFRNAGDKRARMVLVFGATEGSHIARKRHLEATNLSSPDSGETR